MPFELFGRSYPWIPEPFEWLRPAANRAGRALVDWRLRWRYRAAAANYWPPARALVFDTRAWCQRQPDYGGAGGPQYFEIFPPDRVSLVPAQTIAKPRRYRQDFARQHEVQLPAASVIVLPNGRFDGRCQDVTTAAGEMLTELSFYSLDSYYQQARRRLLLPPQSEAPRHLPGNAAVIASMHADWNYFHWLINAVPRFELLRRAGLPPELADWYILTAPPAPFQAETLARLGVPPRKIVIVERAQHVTADRLWATVSLQAAGQNSAWAAGFLRDLFLDDTPRGRLRLYVSRRDAPRHPLVNEPEIEDWLARRGFQSVLPRELTIREQARLFARAEVVVGANGAGLANLVFCPPGTKVIELFSPDWLGTYSWEVSSLRQHEYYYLIGAASQQRSEFAAYHIELPDLSRLLDLAGL